MSGPPAQHPAGGNGANTHGLVVRKGTFSFINRIQLLPAVVSFVGDILFSFVSGLFRGSSGTKTYKMHVINSIVKSMTSKFSSQQIQHLNETYDVIYKKFCASKGIEPDIVTLPNGTVGLWVGSRDAQYVVLNFHGGGFALGLNLQNIEFWYDMQQKLLSSGISIAFFHLNYSLTPHAAYPTQFRQAVEALEYLVYHLNRDVQTVLVSGDSAGANLCLGILSHLSHPSKDGPRLEIKAPLKGAILISPWLSFDTTWGSYKTNLHKDIDDVHGLNTWARDYLGGKPGDNYSEPVLAPEEWWSDAKVSDVILAAGSDEVFIDSIQAWVKKYEATNKNLKFAIGPDESHIAPFIWRAFGVSEETEQAKAIYSWMQEKLKAA